MDFGIRHCQIIVQYMMMIWGAVTVLYCYNCTVMKGYDKAMIVVLGEPIFWYL